MAKQIEEPVDKAEGGDAPLIDLNEASVKKLIARAKKRGVITYDELNEVVGEMSTDQIEDITSALNDMGVNIVENDEAGEDGEAEKEPEDDEPEATTDGSDGFAPVVEKKKEI